MIIYEIKNNNKRYIGKILYDTLQNRISEHIKLLDSNTHYNRLLQKEYDKDTFSYNLIIESEDLDECVKVEKKHIKKYNTNSPLTGYNFFSDDIIKTNTTYRKYNITSDEDVIFHFLLHGNLNEAGRHFNMASLAIKKRLLKNNIIKSKDKAVVGMKNHFRYLCELELCLRDDWMQSGELYNIVYSKYDVSSSLKIYKTMVWKHLKVKGYKSDENESTLFHP